MLVLKQGLGTDNTNVQFLTKFARQSFNNSFACIDFSAGKLPCSCHMLADRTLCGKHETVSINQYTNRNCKL